MIALGGGPAETLLITGGGGGGAGPVTSTRPAISSSGNSVVPGGHSRRYATVDPADGMKSSVEKGKSSSSGIVSRLTE